MRFCDGKVVVNGRTYVKYILRAGFIARLF